MLVWLTLPFYDFCGFRSVAVNSVYKLQFFTFIIIIMHLIVEALRRDSSRLHRHHRTDVTRRHGGSRVRSRRNRQRSGGKNMNKTHEDWLSEADYSCIQDRHTVPPPAVINAHRSTSWAMYGGRPRLYTTYRCNWGYVARPADDVTGNLYCRRGVWVGTAPFCQRFG